MMHPASKWRGLRPSENPLQMVRGIIIMMHEVNDGLDDYARELASGLTAQSLEMIVTWLRQSGWDIVPLKEALRRLEHSQAKQQFAVLTFDDGYRSTLTGALPILERHNAPFTVYVPNGAPTRELNAWWLGLRRLFQRHDSVNIPAMEARLACGDRDSKIKGLRQALDWVHADYQRTTQLDATFRSYDISLAELNATYFLDERELRMLAQRPLVDIGAHTVSHSALALLEPASVRQELADNRNYLERLLDRPVLDLAYPYGTPSTCGEREFALAAEAGFRSGVTTRYGPLRAHCQHHALPRVAAGGTVQFEEFAASITELQNADSADATRAYR